MLFYSRLISLLLMGVLCYVQNSPMFCCTHHITVQLMHFWHVSALSSMHCSLYSVCSAAHNCMYVCCAWLKKGRGGVREGVGGQSRAEHFGRKCSFLFLASTLTKKLPHLFCPKCIVLYWNILVTAILCMCVNTWQQQDLKLYNINTQFDFITMGN